MHVHLSLLAPFLRGLGLAPHKRLVAEGTCTSTRGCWQRQRRLREQAANAELCARCSALGVWRAARRLALWRWEQKGRKLGGTKQRSA